MMKEGEWQKYDVRGKEKKVTGAKTIEGLLGVEWKQGSGVRC